MENCTSCILFKYLMSRSDTEAKTLLCLKLLAQIGLIKRHLKDIGEISINKTECQIMLYTCDLTYMHTIILES